MRAREVLICLGAALKEKASSYRQQSSSAVLQPALQNTASKPKKEKLKEENKSMDWKSFYKHPGS